MNTSMQYDQVVSSTLEEATRDSVHDFTPENAISLAQAAVEYKISNTVVNLQWCQIEFHCYRSTTTANRKPNGDFKYLPDDYRQLEVALTFFGDKRENDTKVEMNVYDGNSFNEMLAAFYALKAIFLDMDNDKKSNAYASMFKRFKSLAESKKEPA